MVVFCFFFFKQKTAYEMRISDWSSDVCSSDLFAQRRGGNGMADFARWAVGPDQVRERRLKLGIAPHQRVIFGIGDLGRILGVIEPVVMRDCLGQPHQLVGGFGFGEGVAHTPSSSRSACARASGVPSAPDSIRPTPCLPPASATSEPPVRVAGP